jgi:hypothetical protein
MQRMVGVAAALVMLPLVATSAPAAADVAIAAAPMTSPAPPPGPEQHRTRRFDARAGFLLGGADVGDADGLSVGFHGQLGFRVDDVTLFGELDYFSVGDGPDEALMRTGRTTRYGLAARYALYETPDDAALGGEFWVEAGAGYEDVRWKQGGVLRRPDLALGLGLELDARPGDNERHRHLGWYLGFRTILAGAPDSDAPETCGGPCEEPSGPSRTDVSFYFLVGLHWGRG